MDDPNPTTSVERGRLQVFWWPSRVLGPAPGLLEINIAAWGLFTGFVVVPIAYRLWSSLRAGLGISKILPIDFIYFYGIGKLVHEHSIGRLYDYPLQLKVFNDIYPVGDGSYGPSPYPPWVALFFSLFARMPLAGAYLLWMACSLLLFLVGITAILRGGFFAKRLELSLIYCGALTFYPFAINTLANGQLASIAVFSVGAAIFLERRNCWLWSGIALSILSYKLTLLLLIVPMLLITRRFRTVIGFLIGVAAQVLVVTAFTGLQIWQNYLGFLGAFSHTAGIGGQSVLLGWKYVDFSALFHFLFGREPRVGLVCLIALSVVILCWSGVLLWRSSGGSWPVQSMAWAVILGWTLLLNVYVPIYDSVLIVIALILTIESLRALGRKEEEDRMVLLMALTFACSWVTTSAARKYGVQLLTIMLFACAAAQTYLLNRAIRKQRAVEGR